MALIEIKVPQLSESVAEATLLQWHKKPGEAITRDENLIDIETDKVVLELPAPDNGVITQVLRPDGATVVSGEVIAILDTEAKAGAAAAPNAANTPVTSSLASVVATSASFSGLKSDVAMPAAAKMLAENSMSVSQVAGTGKDGRVTKGDVISQLATGAAKVATPPAAPTVAIPTGAIAKTLPSVSAPISAAAMLEEIGRAHV